MRLRRARDEGRLDREAEAVGRARLLVIDELGFLPLDADGARLLFQVFVDAYERQSVVITINIGMGAWGQVFGDDAAASAIADRVCHLCHIIKITGSSYRLKDLPRERRREE